MMYMPIIDINKPSGQELFRQYMDKKIVPLAYEVCWQQETPEVRKCMKGYPCPRFQNLGKHPLGLALRR